MFDFQDLKAELSSSFVNPSAFWSFVEMWTGMTRRWSTWWRKKWGVLHRNLTLTTETWSGSRLCDVTRRIVPKRIIENHVVGLVARPNVGCCALIPMVTVWYLKVTPIVFHEKKSQWSWALSASPCPARHSCTNFRLFLFCFRPVVRLLYRTIFRTRMLMHLKFLSSSGRSKVDEGCHSLLQHVDAEVWHFVSPRNSSGLSRNWILNFWRMWVGDNAPGYRHIAPVRWVLERNLRVPHHRCDARDIAPKRVPVWWLHVEQNSEEGGEERRKGSHSSKHVKEIR